MVQLSSSGLTSNSSSLERLQQEFAQFHTVKLENFLEPNLLELVSQAISHADFETREDKQIAVEHRMAENVGLHSLLLLMNDPKLFSLVQSITSCRSIQGFFGRVYRMVPDSGDFDTWHDDDTGQRLIGVSINLSTSNYQGGTFEIKYRINDQYIRSMPNLGFGDAILFRIREDLLHRVTLVEGEIPKTAFAGWFQNNPGPFAHLKAKVVVST